MGGYATSGAGGLVDGAARSHEGQLGRTDAAGEESRCVSLSLPLFRCPPLFVSRLTISLTALPHQSQTFPHAERGIASGIRWSATFFLPSSTDRLFAVLADMLWRTAYYIAFGAHGPRALPPPGEGWRVAGYTAVGVAVSFALFVTLHMFARGPPSTMTKEYQEATNEYLKVCLARPIYRHPTMHFGGSMRKGVVADK